MFGCYRLNEQVKASMSAKPNEFADFDRDGIFSHHSMEATDND
jgi:hypothetical protein